MGTYHAKKGLIPRLGCVPNPCRDYEKGRVAKISLHSRVSLWRAKAMISDLGSEIVSLYVWTNGNPYDRAAVVTCSV
jgi:hypothetical protein